MMRLNSSKDWFPLTMKKSQTNKYSLQALSTNAYCSLRNSASKEYCNKFQTDLLVEWNKLKYLNNVSLYSTTPIIRINLDRTRFFYLFKIDLDYFYLYLFNSTLPMLSNIELPKIRWYDKLMKELNNISNFPDLPINDD